MDLKTRYFAVALFSVAIAIAVFLYARGRPEVPRIGCDLNIGCSFALKGQIIRVRTLAPIRVGQPFRLEVNAPHAARVKAQFDMNGMNMPTPIYNLQRRGSNWFAEVTLPYCISGRSDWVSRLQIDNETIEIEFNVLP